MLPEFKIWKPVGIHEVFDKSAFVLAGQYMHDNDYCKAIVKASRILVDAGYIHAQYVTQYGSGTTVWSLGLNSNITVNSEGIVS